MDSENASGSASGSDEDMEWDEVIIPPLESSVTTATELTLEEKARPNIEITLNVPRSKAKADLLAKKLREEALLERVVRLESHKLHTICLLANGSIRNKWINDDILHARLMSLTPLALQNSFLKITKKNQPDAAHRGRQFEAAMIRLVEWWSQTFDVKLGVGIRSRSFGEVQTQSPDPTGKGKGRAIEPEDPTEGEIIKSPKSLMKHAVTMRGSRDVSAQLFTALCRSLGLPARLVVSLQGVLWKKKSSGERNGAQLSRKGKGRQADAGESDGPAEDKSIDGHSTDQHVNSSAKRKGKGKGKPSLIPPVRLRKRRPPPRRLSPLPMDSPPVFWTEVFSRPDGRWLCVDPIRAIVEKPRRFEPLPTDKTNKMLYVVGFEPDGFARDVTPRYAKQFSAKTAKVRASGRTGSSKKDWWDGVIRVLSRPYRLNRDDVEDAEFQNHQILEGMPTAMSGFKDHPLYALERHLRQTDVIHPRTELGKFRGEPVFPRSSVIPLRSSDTWMRKAGRVVRIGEQPLKMIKLRAVTVHKRRAVEMAKTNTTSTSVDNSPGKKDGELDSRTIGAQATEGDDGGLMQGLYADWQTQLYVPVPVLEGVIPKNDFGNIDLYVPSMLPDGAVHIPLKGVAKIAKQLGFDFAEAVTGFEFKKQRATPVLTGIVVAAENEQVLLEAYWDSAQAAEQKERERKHERVLTRWTRLVQGLRIRQRLQAQFAVHDAPVPFIGQEAEGTAGDQPASAGGFLTQIGDVVEPYNLPKFLHPVAGAPNTNQGVPSLEEEEIPDSPSENAEAAMQFLQEDFNMPEGEAHPNPEPLSGATNSPPKSLLEIADADAASRPANRTPASTRRPGSSKPSPRSNLHRPGGAVSTERRSKENTPGAVTNQRKRRKVQEDSDTSHMGDSDQEGEGDEKGARGARVRQVKRSKPAPAARELRTRVPKTAEQIRQEKERERAYRRATAR